MNHCSSTTYLVDFDGTLANTKRANYFSYAEALKECNINIDFDNFMKISDGKHWKDFLPVIFDKYNTTSSITAQQIALMKTEIYKTQVDKISFNEPLIILLKSVATHSNIALVTTASKLNVETALNSRPDVIKLFKLIITGEDVAKHKPDPEAYFLAAKKLNVEPTECIIFEDSAAGIKAGEVFGGNVIKTYI